MALSETQVMLIREHLKSLFEAYINKVLIGNEASLKIRKKFNKDDLIL